MIKKQDSNEVYHSSAGISASGLKLIYKKSVYHYLKQRPFESAAMAFGSAVHAAILEPDTFFDLYHIMPKIDRRTKEGKAAYATEQKKAGDKLLLTPEDYDKIEAILDNYRNNDLAQKYCKGVIELSHYTKHNDLDVRVRPDCINVVEDYISDVKTCQDNAPIAFRRDIYKYGYHLQAAFYMDMLGINNFKFIAVETNYPFSIEVYTLSDEMLEAGRNAWKKAFSDYELYMTTGIVRDHIWNEFADDGSKIL